MDLLVMHDLQQGLRILDHACDFEIENPGTPLQLWEKLDKDTTGGFFRGPLVKLTFYLRKVLPDTHEPVRLDPRLEHPQILCVEIPASLLKYVRMKV
jgi:hypothetical protein